MTSYQAIASALTLTKRMVIHRTTVYLGWSFLVQHTVEHDCLLLLSLSLSWVFYSWARQ